MNTGRQWPSELSEHQDPRSGAHVRQLTNYLGNSNHFYFTYPCWYDGGRKLIPGEELSAGESTRTYRARRFQITLASSPNLATSTPITRGASPISYSR